MKENEMIELELIDILNRKSQTDIALMALLREKGGVRSLPVLMGPVEAQGLAATLHKFKAGRPSVFDLYANTLQHFDCIIDRVEIYRIEGGVFYSHIFLEREGCMTFVDSRTSDAVTLALGAGAPIYIDDKLFADHCMKSEGNGAFSMPISTVSMSVLQEALAKAVQNEDYEFAARLRDEINSRKG